MAVTQDYTWNRGETVVITDTITDDGTADGTPVNITGWTLQAYLTTNGAQVVKTIGNGITVTDAPNGVCTITFARDDTEDVQPGTYQWALWRMDAGNEAALTKGTVTLGRTARR